MKDKTRIIILTILSIIELSLILLSIYLIHKGEATWINGFNIACCSALIMINIQNIKEIK